MTPEPHESAPDSPKTYYFYSPSAAYMASFFMAGRREKTIVHFSNHHLITTDPELAQALRRYPDFNRGFNEVVHPVPIVAIDGMQDISTGGFIDADIVAHAQARWAASVEASEPEDQGRAIDAELTQIAADRQALRLDVSAQKVAAEAQRKSAIKAKAEKAAEAYGLSEVTAKPHAE